MKITIEPSGTEYNHNTVSVESKYDDLDINAAGELVRAALQAWGYAEQTVNELLGKP